VDELWKRAASGDKDAFSDLVMIYQQQLYKIARAKLDNDCDICDALQNTLLLAYKHIKQVKQVSFFKTWLIKILLNECSAIYRKRNRNGVMLTGTETTLYLSDRNNIASEDYSAIESNIDFFALISMLNDEEKQAITLFYSSDLSIKEISRLTGINENTVKTRLSRAKAKVAKRMKEVQNL
jgi:RNA polymerase sigma-70 factor (ECF subfamily)